MATFYDEYGNEVDPYAADDPQPEPEDRNPLRSQIKRQEKQIRDLTKQVTEGQTAVKQLEFVKAGVDLTNPMASYFVDGYKGELTGEAIKAEAARLNLIPAAAPEERVTPADRASHERMQQAVQDGTTPAERDFDAEMRAAKNPAEMDRIYTEKAAASNAHPGVPAIVND